MKLFYFNVGKFAKISISFYFCNSELDPTNAENNTHLLVLAESALQSLCMQIKVTVCPFQRLTWDTRLIIS